MSKSVKEEIADIFSALEQADNKIRNRKAQRIMVAEVAKTFWGVCEAKEGDTPLKVIGIEAPTGSGKGLGYLIPGIVVARRQKKTLVVSTATVKLQQQLCSSDLPLLQQAIPGGITFAIAKGRRRYVCPSRLEREAGAASQMDMLPDSVAPSKNSEADRMIVTLHRDFEARRWNGDRDCVNVSDEIWRDISTDRSGCTGSRCSHHKACPFVTARESMSKVDVVVANHDLVLSDLALGGGVVLPDPSASLFCIDEAHHMPEKTLSAFASSFQMTSVDRAIERIGGETARGIPDLAIREALVRQAEAVSETLADLYHAISGLAALAKEGDVLRFPYGEMPDDLATLGNNVLGASRELVETLAKANDWAKDNAEAEMSKANAEKLLTDLSLNIEIIDGLYSTWLQMLKESTPPLAKWIEVVSHGRGKDYRFNASPISAAEGLKSLFYDVAAGVVLTSATLSALGKFDLFLNESGMSLMGNQAKCISLPSPFDHASQGTLLIPRMKSMPKDADNHTIELSWMIPAVYPETGGMLVLFSSYRQMNYVVSQLPRRLRDMTLVQGEHPMDAIIDMHKERVQKDGRSVLFGLQSMAEGVDLPRNFCVRVVITKLPFDVPSDPIAQTAAEWLEFNGKNPFGEVSLPAVSRKLNQWTGRLLRSEEDWGDVILFDPRLIKSGYGAKLLDALPPFKRVLNYEVTRLAA